MRIARISALISAWAARFVTTALYARSTGGSSALMALARLVCSSNQPTKVVALG
jgi:hypothetical protein